MGRGETDQVDALLLSVAILDRPMVVLTAEGSAAAADRILEHYTSLGGPIGEAFSLGTMTRDQLQRGIQAAASRRQVFSSRWRRPVAPGEQPDQHRRAHHHCRGLQHPSGAYLIGSGPVQPRWEDGLSHTAALSPALGRASDERRDRPHFAGTEHSPVRRALPHIDENCWGWGFRWRRAALGHWAR